MTDYNTEQAWNIFQQFGNDASTPTMDYADGTSADAFNTGTGDFGSYSVGPSEHDLSITNPYDPSLPANRSGYDGNKYPIDGQVSSQSNLIMYLAIAGVAISLLALVRR